ncbi:sugar phosphate isomerase/epimerase family protein [Mycetocola zhadangensis]|uniref:Sugar phosphate isomerase/epimerase n=1 Tax=Mycetocola zhadangensis TaxID=1164595 RepID=A0A3L7J081_9MICO|nr:TIM barrel protein [Mycetocola zhadangensis]RLQ82792.1 sugar phosphate isomerase/epimerase [Mycetocola zhadangensis]GGE98081.1 sugar phosphate isomerase [Mycetocola zhadangensis]
MRTRSTPSVRPGLCSVSLRESSVDEVLSLAASAGLESIEWGGDVHVPPGDTDTAKSVGERTRAAGLDVASLGSYYRCDLAEDFSPVLSSAAALGAPRIRVWAGEISSADATPIDREEIATRLDSAASHASEYGIELALEFHNGTLADTAESTLALLSDVASTNVSCYWQPPVDMNDDAALAELSQLAARVSTVHVFSWWPQHERLPLSSRSELWTRALPFTATFPSVTDALLEFLPDDDPALLNREAATLRAWLS